MDNEAIYEKLLEVSTDIKVTKALFEQFVNHDFKQHQEEDRKISAITYRTAQKINRIFWSVGSCIALVAFVEALKVLWT